MPQKENKTPMEKLTARYEKFIKGKELKEDGKKLFSKAIKKASNPKHRGLK